MSNIDYVANLDLLIRGTDEGSTEVSNNVLLDQDRREEINRVLMSYKSNMQELIEQNNSRPHPERSGEP